MANQANGNDRPSPRRPRPQVVVSMTSFPAAIPYAAQAVRSILNGSVLPDKLVLYLTASQFTESGIPEALRGIEADSPIFEVRTYERNIRSYTKLIPALTDFPDAIIVTVDDDIAYHRHTLRDLLRWHHKMPDVIWAHRVRRIDTAKPYRHWHKYRWYDFLFKRIRKGYNNLLTGVGGVLYPPNSLKREMLDADLFMEMAPTADDIWFWAAAVAQGTPVVPVPFGHYRPRELNKPGDISLMTLNYRGQTDRNTLALNKILERYPELSTHL